MKVCLITHGCAKNLVDSEMILGLSKDNNIQIVTKQEEADVIIINTCGFIESAKKESLGTIFDVINSKRTDQKLICCGCLSTRYINDLPIEIPEVDRFISIKDYDHFQDIFNEVVGQKVLTKNIKDCNRLISTQPHTAYVRIGDGCDNRCAYCAIPLIRGDFVSRTTKEVVEECKWLVAEGYKELVLIAQDTTRFGKENGESIEGLLEEICKIKDLFMVRLLYMYPWDVNENLINTFKDNPKIAPYFDIPVQHGSNRILKAMNRRDTKEKIYSLAKLIRDNFKEPIIRTTLIVGFPGETDEDFNELLQMVKDIKFDRLGVFKYSDEEGTLGYNYDNKIDEETMDKRYNIVMETQAKIAQELSESKIGNYYDVFIEGYNVEKQMYHGRSFAYAPDDVDGCIYLKKVKKPHIGQIVKVKITDALIYDLIGEVVED